MKVTVIGAGNVGATAANVIALKNIASELVLLDIKPGVAEGKVMDMMQTAHMLGIDTRLIASSDDYVKTKASDIIVITSGLARKPGMTREELID
ncbi:MAG: lactate/malate family dehydrogenase, partial [Selenomonadaceae bacterium]